MKLRKRDTCRVCGGKTLIDILTLGNLAISGFFDNETDGIKAPLTLSLCDPEQGGCSLVQLRHKGVNPEILYREYWYKSGISQTMKDALRDVVTKSRTYVNLEPSDIVLDIGANDGTLLSYYESTFTRVGFEPAHKIAAEASLGGNTILDTFFNKSDFELKFPTQKAKIITSIAMFYDLEDPNTFVSDIKAVLHPDGIWVNQLSYLPLMLSQNAFDNICHEHIEYYSLTSMKHIIDKHDLEIVDVELNDVNGGSFRVYIGHKNSINLRVPQKGVQRVEDLLKDEQKLMLHTQKPYMDFSERINDLKNKTRRVIRNIVKNGGSVYLYGASTKGNTLLQYYGLDSTVISGAAERNPDKWGKKTVATNIPIISEEEARKSNPTHFLVLPWHFKNEFIDREKEYLSNGGHMIFPLPEFEIISKNDVAVINQ